MLLGEGPDTDWVHRRATTTPTATALRVPSSDSQWTFTELDAAVTRTAERLHTAGVESGTHVGLLTTRQAPFVTGVFGTIRLGGTAVPLHTRLPEAELASRLDKADIEYLICDAETEATGARAGTDTPTLLTIDTPTTDHATGPLATLERQDIPDTAPATNWLIMFTSGTTGVPKPVVITARNLYASAVSSGFRLGVEATDHWLDPLPPYHMGGLAPVFRSVLYGTTVVMQDGFDPTTTRSIMEELPITGLSVVPTMLEDMLEDGPLPPVRFVLCGGAPTPPELIDRCATRGVPVCPTYGMTETASQVATVTPGEAHVAPETVGHPLYGMEITILDDGDPQPRGATGEIVVDGPMVTPGYYNAPTATEAAFDEHGLHTGDRGKLTEAGRLVVLGRNDRMIISGGENIDPQVVEDVITSHPAVTAAAVVGIPDDRWGEQVGAAVVGNVTPADVYDACRAELAKFKCPQQVLVIEKLPRTPSGTIDYTTVEQHIRDRGTVVKTTG